MQGSLTDKWTVRLTDRQAGKQTYLTGRTDYDVNGWKDRLMRGQTSDGWTDEWTGGWTDEWTDK